jgi:glycosyltransferase involved in cell wall biosynthesis
MTLPRFKLVFVIESGTDIRLVEGLAERFDLTLLGRQTGHSLITHPTSASFTTILGPSSRVKFAQFVWVYLRQQQAQFDYVIVQGYGVTAVAANLASRLTGTPTAMLVCSPSEAYYSCRKACTISGKSFRWYELWGLRAIAFANAVLGQQYLALSQHLIDVVHSYGIKKPATFLPIYGVDTTLFTPPDVSKITMKAELGLPTTGSIIFFSSRVAPEKDSETLLLAFQYLLKEGRDLWLLHRSGGYQEFYEQAERNGIASRVIATDAVHPHHQLPLDYQACDLCVQSSRQEGLGFSPLESLACGTPVIASAVGGLKETIIDGYTGWTYPVGNSRALAECITIALDHPIKAKETAIAGRKLVCEKYERQIVFDQLSEIVQQASRSQGFVR